MRRLKQQGVTLIELMVGMAIGLIILSLSYQIFIGSKTTHNRILSQSRMQENARYAFSFIANSVRNTGYRDTAEELPDIAFSDSNNPLVSGSDGTDLPVAGEPATLSFSSRSVDVMVGSDTISLANVAQYSDVLVVRYQGGEYERAITDCVGEPVLAEENNDNGTPADDSDDFSDFTVYAADIIYARVAPVDGDNRSRFRLHCRRERMIQPEGGVPARHSKGGTTLVEDITAFQVRLGVDTTGDQTVDVYQTFTDGPDLSRIRSIEITLDAKGGRTLDLLESAAAQTVSSSELLQQQFQRTFALRNLAR